MPSPLVSCIMPTRDRRAVVPRSIAFFLRQDYERRELIVVDDGDDPVADLVPDDPRIRYVRLAEPLVLGEKRNVACELTRGEIVLHWDDDDWYARDRVSVQVAALEAAGAELCGSRRILFLADGAERAWVYEYPAANGRWLAGTALCYRRSFWQRHPFEPLAVGEDTYFVWSCGGARVVELADSSYVVAVVHGGNTSAKGTAGRWWRERPVAEVEALLGPELALFR